jgi:hypothetical protein
VADHRDSGAGEGDVVRPLDARLRASRAPRPPAGRVLPGLSRHAGLRAAAPGGGAQAADAGPRRARGPGLLAGRGGANGARLWRGAAALPRPDPRPDARARLAGCRGADRRLVAKDATGRRPCRRSPSNEPAGRPTGR